MEFTYSIKRSTTAKNIRLSIHRSGKVTVTIPRFVPERMAHSFVTQKQEWVTAKLHALQERQHDGRLQLSTDYGAYKQAARELVERRLLHFNTFYGYTYFKISIRNQQTRWGSCSRIGNLSFNYRIALLPPEIADYIIVHELCHRGEFNHSNRFWNLVALTIPQYQKLRADLQKYLL